MVNQKQCGRLLHSCPIQSTALFFIAESERKSSPPQPDRAWLVAAPLLQGSRSVSDSCIPAAALLSGGASPSSALHVSLAVSSPPAHRHRFPFRLLTHVVFAESPSLAEQLPSLAGSFPISSINIF